MVNGHIPPTVLFASGNGASFSQENLLHQLSITVQHVWRNGVSRSDIAEWLDNFTGEVHNREYERQLALWLLTHFVYYNEQEVRHLCRTLYHDYVHFAISGLHSLRDTHAQISRILRETRFYFLGRPGESGSYVLYYFRQENELGIRSFISDRGSLPDAVTTVAFLDDVTLSGDQATKYIERQQDDVQFGSRNVVLLTFFATQEAISLLRPAKITVIPAVVLDDRCRCFSDNSNAFHELDEHRLAAKSMAEHYGLRLCPRYPLGYKDGQYAFGFFYNTPDNALPIFWSEVAGWRPIMRRYDKLKEKWVEDDYDRFV